MIRTRNQSVLEQAHQLRDRLENIASRLFSYEEMDAARANAARDSESLSHKLPKFDRINWMDPSSLSTRKNGQGELMVFFRMKKSENYLTLEYLAHLLDSLDTIIERLSQGPRFQYGALGQLLANSALLEAWAKLKAETGKVILEAEAKCGLF